MAATYALRVRVRKSVRGWVGGDNIAEKKGGKRGRAVVQLCDMRPLYATLITRQDIGLSSFSL